MSAPIYQGRTLPLLTLLLAILYPAIADCATPAPTLGTVSISGNHLVRDGLKWTPHGLVTIAYVAPPAAQRGLFIAAYKHATDDQLLAIKAWGADTVRMQVSQPGLDPENPLFTQSFLNTVKSQVLAARSAGLNVIVSVQDELQSGEKKPVALPDAATSRVWKELAPLFNADEGILYEVLNEPKLIPNPKNWDDWARSMNAAISAIRATGSNNVVIVDGLNYGETLQGAPALRDRANQIAYASHPYFHNEFDQTEAAWALKFGNLAKTSPVIITEWTTGDKKPFCDTNTPAAALAFLNYLNVHGVGLTGFAYDFGKHLFGSVVVDYKGTPSTYAQGLQCGTADFGPGTLIQKWFRTGSVPKTLE